MASNSKSNRSSCGRDQRSPQSGGSGKSRDLSEKPRGGRDKLGDKYKGHTASGQPPLRPTKPKE